MSLGELPPCAMGCRGKHFGPCIALRNCPRPDDDACTDQTPCPTCPRSWRLDLPWTAPPLSLNPRQHGHWAKRAAVVREVRQTASVLARAAGIPPLARIAAELHYVPRDKRRRDPINLTPTAKALEDGLVDAGVVPDDTPEFSVPTMPTVHPPAGAAACMYLLVREVRP